MIEYRNILLTALSTIRSNIIANHVRNKQRASGNFERGLQINVNNFRGQLWGVEYSEALEIGNKPTDYARPYFLTLKGKIQEWARYKGVDLKKFAKNYKGIRAKRTHEETGLQNLTYLIISRGTRLHQSGRKSGTISDAISDSELEKLFDSIYFEVTKKFNFE